MKFWWLLGFCFFCQSLDPLDENHPNYAENLFAEAYAKLMRATTHDEKLNIGDMLLKVIHLKPGHRGAYFYFSTFFFVHFFLSRSTFFSFSNSRFVPQKGFSSTFFQFFHG